MAHFMGPCLTLAGPGSGKTHTLTCRIRHLITQCQVPPEQILVITFTKAAAMEMEQRFTALMGEYLPVVFGTFHSIFYRMLQEEHTPGAQTFLTEKAKQQLLKETAAICHLASDQKDFFRLLSKELSYIKNTQTDPSGYQSRQLPGADLAKVYKTYEALKDTYQMLDFDDMLTKTLEMFERSPDVLKKWQRRFSFFLIDEAQDMNALQFQIIRMLALPGNHLFLVGDDDQSIYGFRGADPGLLMKAEQYYPGCRRILLKENYRCAASITESALHLISHNQARFEKEIHSVKRERGLICQNAYINAAEEAQGILKKIHELTEEGKKLSDMAVLCRVHSQLQVLLGALTQEKLPFYIKDHMMNPWDHWIVKDVTAYLALAREADGKMKRSRILQVMNRPARYLARASLGSEEITFEQWKRFYQGKDWMIERLDLLQKQLRYLRKLPGFAAICYIRKEMGYDRYVRDYLKSHPEDGQWEEAMEQLLILSKGSANIREVIHRVETLRERIREENEKKGPGDGLGLYTIHGAKGLEFPVVFLPGCNEGDCPSKNAGTAEQVEEERRIFYVAITRAKEQLYLSWVKEDMRGKKYPSRFLKEMGEG